MEEVFPFDPMQIVVVFHLARAGKNIESNENENETFSPTGGLPLPARSPAA